MLTIHTVLSRVPAPITAVLVVLAAAIAAAQASAAVPANGRAWELVTPPDPNGAATARALAVAADGDRIAYATGGPLPGSKAGSLVSPNYAERTPLGWRSLPLAMPYSVPEFTFLSPELVGASTDMSHWIWSSPHPLTPDGPSNPGRGMYSSNGTEAVATLLAAVADGFEFSGGSHDMRKLFFQSRTALLPEDVRTSGRQVYERTDAGLQLIGVDSSGAPLTSCGAIVGSNSYPPNPISDDGRRVFIASPDANCGTVRRRVYLREGTTTTEISAPRCTRVAPPCNAEADVRFMGATPSGSAAFVVTAQQLTDDDTDVGQDLYRYDVAGGVLSRVSAGAPGTVASVLSTAAYPSDDGSRVYFVATGVLVPGEGTPGIPNVYLADAEGLRFVATLGGSDDSWRNASAIASRREDVQLTPDGARLAFMTTAQLTADDTDASKDVYLYDAEQDTLRRVSGMPGGGNGTFSADIAQNSGSQPTAGHPLRSLSRDGRHLFFHTAEALIADDGNTTTDIYEWKDGDLGLVSSGRASTIVRYNTASADGRSVFFATDESLTAEDDDGGYPDLYVAREGGGFPVVDRTTSPGCADRLCASSPGPRLSRSVPASVGLVERAAGRLRVLPVSAAALRRMVANGRLRLRVRTTKAGRIVAQARARIGRRTRTVAGGQMRATGPGTVRLQLPLSRAARRRLSAGHGLLVRLVVRRSRPSRSTTVSLKLEPPR
jgi:hypothetical protein